MSGRSTLVYCHIALALGATHAGAVHALPAAQNQRPATTRGAPSTRPAQPLAAAGADLDALAHTVLQDAPHIGNPLVREQVLSRTCELMIRAGRFTFAQELCRRLEGGNAKQLAGRLVAMRRLAGDPRGAAQALRDLTMFPDDDEIAVGTALAQADAGELAAARATLKAIGSNGLKIQAYVALLRITRDRHDLQSLLDAIGDDRRGHASDVAEAQALADDVAGAKKTAQGDPEALYRIARAQASAGGVAGARETRKQLADNVLYGDAATLAIAAAQAGSGDVKGTEGTAAGILSGQSRPEAAAVVAYARARSGDAGGAVAAIDPYTGKGRDDEVCLGYALIARAHAERGAGSAASNEVAKTRALVETLSGGTDRASGAMRALEGFIEGPSAARGSGIPPP